MKGRRKIILCRHFLERWSERIGHNTPGQIRHRLHSAILNKPLRSTGRGWAVDIHGCHAVCAIDYAGRYVFITLLSHEMERR